jgi:UDP-N-acetylglucosamine acyltransferase
MTIHETTTIDSSARIDSSVEVGPYCVIGPNVVLGAGCMLHDHVSIQRDTIIGEQNVFHPFCVIGGDPQDRKYDGEQTMCQIGNGNEVREHVTIHRGTENGGSVTTIGNENLLMVGSHVAHDCRIGDEVVIANQVMLAGHVSIENGASIGGGAGIHHFATIGSCSFVGGLARISRDVPPFMIVEGHPAEVRALNVIALARRGYEPSHVEALKESFKRLFRGNGSVSTHTRSLREEFADVPAVLKLCDSMDASSDGTHGRALESRRKDDKWSGKVEAESR